MGADDSFEAVVTVAGIEGDKVDYDIEPAVSQTQLEAAVKRMLGASTKVEPDSVSCQSGLDGQVGSRAYCDVTSRGSVARRAVAVTAVTGLSMKYGLVPILPKPILEQSLLLQLRRNGKQPTGATCRAGLEGLVGNTTDCTTMSAGGGPEAYVVTVTTVKNDQITFKYTAKP